MRKYVTVTEWNEMQEALLAGMRGSFTRIADGMYEVFLFYFCYMQNSRETDQRFALKDRSAV